MILGQQIQKRTHVRTSKNGREHEYYRNMTIVMLRCDSCGDDFERERREMDPKRLSNNYFHVCSNCDAKRFAQKRGVEKKKVWDLRASSNIPIGKL
jgi:hypothetical protein